MTNDLHLFADIHTHTLGTADSIVSLPPRQAMQMAQSAASRTFYSLELHPWWASDTLIDEFLAAAQSLRHDPYLVAIGECGLDGSKQRPQQGPMTDTARPEEPTPASASGKGHRPEPLLRPTAEGRQRPWQMPDLETQRRAFRTALLTARRLGLPVVVHCVKLWSEMLAEVKAAGLGAEDTPPVIIHGFRKGPDLARRLLAAGCSISLGRHHAPGIEAIIPPERLYHETDQTHNPPA